MALRNSIGKVVEFAQAHRAAALVGTAAAAGLYRAHPWRKMSGIGAVVGLPTKPWSTDSIVSDMFLGDPNAIAKINRGAATKAIADSISPYNDAGIPFDRSGGPDGSMVFGLYNDRLK